MAEIREDIVPSVAPAQPVIAKAITPAQSQAMVKDLLVDGWPIRRRVMFAALGYIVVMTTYLILWAEDTALHRDLGNTLLYCGAAIIGTYVFGAVWDDMNKRSTMVEYDTSYPTPVQQESA